MIEGRRPDSRDAAVALARSNRLENGSSHKRRVDDDAASGSFQINSSVGVRLFPNGQSSLGGYRVSAATAILRRAGTCEFCGKVGPRSVQTVCCKQAFSASRHSCKCFSETC